MQTASSAKRTCSASLSAVECTATVPMPNSRQARMIRSAISPRLAIRIFLNKASLRGAVTDLRRFDAEQRLAELHRTAVLHQDLGDPAGELRLDFVHQLH